MGINPLFLTSKQLAVFLISITLVVVLSGQEVLAQSSLGLGRSEQAVQPSGFFAGLLFWIQQQQQAFYKAMTGALKAMREDPAKIWILVGLSFLYGVFHAAGPGHGKAVISSYVLANNIAARRGIMISFVSALLQGITAILVVGFILLALRGSGIKSGDISGTLEISSYFLVMMLGLYLLWTKLFKKSSHADTGHHHDHAHSQGANHSDDAVCSTCGHSHAVDPSMLEGKVGVKEMWTAIAAVGVRPCSGALIVLTFAFLNGLYAGGILSTFAMSIGTGITVATLALLAVGAKGVALKFAGMQDRAEGVNRIIEIAGAALVFLLGLLLFSAALQA